MLKNQTKYKYGGGVSMFRENVLKIVIEQQLVDVVPYWERKYPGLAVRRLIHSHMDAEELIRDIDYWFFHYECYGPNDTSMSIYVEDASYKDVNKVVLILEELVDGDRGEILEWVVIDLDDLEIETVGPYTFVW